MLARTAVQLVPPSVEYCQAPSVMGSAALAVTNTPFMVSAPFGWPASFESEKRGVNRPVAPPTGEPLGVKLPSSVVGTTTGPEAVSATGRSFTGVTSTVSVPVVVATASEPSLLSTVMVKVTGAGLCTSVGGVSVAPVACVAVNPVAAAAVMSIPALSLSIQPAGIPVMVTVG